MQLNQPGDSSSWPQDHLPVRVSIPLKKGLSGMLQDMQRALIVAGTKMHKLQVQQSEWLQSDVILPADPNMSSHIKVQAQIQKELAEAVRTLRAILYADNTIPHDQEGGVRWGLDRLLRKHMREQDAACYHVDDRKLPEIVETHGEELAKLLDNFGGPIHANNDQRGDDRRRR